MTNETVSLIGLLRETKDDLVWIVSGENYAYLGAGEQKTIENRIREIDDFFIAEKLAKAQEKQNCPACGGLGCVSGSEMTCCGNVTDHGECRSHCVIEQQIRTQCPCCGGEGSV